jgi:hypothetical protein
MMDLRELYQDIILDHGRHRRRTGAWAGIATGGSERPLWGREQKLRPETYR